MTTKQYLNQIERMDRNINNKLSEIYQLKTMANNITVSADSERVQTSGDKDRIGTMVTKLIDAENEAEKLIDEYIDTRRQIICQIDCIKQTSYYQVLFSKYAEYKTFEKIAEEMNYSWRQIIRIHGYALAEFEKMFGSLYMS